jgi:predicted RNA-binding Zn ribbon-like protein
MAETEVENLKLIGGRLCLDFVNTVGGRRVQAEKQLRRDYRQICGDKLGEYADLVHWGEHAGALTAAEARGLLREAETRPEEAGAVFARALRLREAIYRIFKSQIAGWKIDAADVELVNRELTNARSHDRLRLTGGRFRWGWDGSREALDYLLWVITRSAAELLTSDEVLRVRECGGESCGWLFFDTSRNRSRQWCVMQDCGNLAKVRRFRTRQKETS